jgi:hypothetical protein
LREVLSCEETSPFKKIFSLKEKRKKKKALRQVSGFKKARAERSGVHFTLSFLNPENYICCLFISLG